MARIRTIKPEFFTSEDITTLSPLARLFYVSLWCESDREGRLSWRKGTLKQRYLPADNVDIDLLAKELIDAGLIVLYIVEGKEFAEIPSFTNHQVINNREADSVIPSRVKVASPRVPVEGRKGMKGKEGKGKEGIDDLESSEIDLFAEFWKAYPNKVGKDACRKAFDKRKVTPELLKTMIQAVNSQKMSKQWLQLDGQYIPHPSTWLNEGRWLDEGILLAAPVNKEYEATQRRIAEDDAIPRSGPSLEVLEKLANLRKMTA